MRYDREIFRFLYKINFQRPSSVYSLDFYDYIFEFLTKIIFEI